MAFQIGHLDPGHYVGSGSAGVHVIRSGLVSVLRSTFTRPVRSYQRPRTSQARQTLGRHDELNSTEAVPAAATAALATASLRIKELEKKLAAPKKNWIAF